MRTRTLIFLALLVPKLAWARPVRLALVVGYDLGVAPDLPLKYAEKDATRVAEVLRELGQFDEVRVQTGASATGLKTELDRLRQAVRRFKSNGDQVFVLLFYSGHGDDRELHLGGTVFSTDELLARLADLGADLRVAVVDACQSGALAREKGVSAKAPVQIAIQDQLDASGQAILASTSQGESAQESETLQGSFFTSYFISGLRGSADSNSDGVVTLQEAHAYAYDRTVRGTAASAAGMQHPTYSVHLHGKRDVALSWPNRSSAFLTFRSRSPGSFLILNESEESVVAEVQTRAADSRRIGLPEAGYVVKKRSTKELLVARIKLRKGTDAVLDESEMQRVPYAVLTKKGERTPGRLMLSAGVGAPIAGVDTLFGLEAGAMLTFGRFALWPSMGLDFGSGAPNELNVVLASVRPGMSLVGLARFFRWDLFYGLKGSVPLYFDFIEGSGWRETIGFDAVGLFGASMWLSDRTGVVSSIEAGAHVLELQSDFSAPSAWAVRPAVAVRIGVQFRL